MTAADPLLPSLTWPAARLSEAVAVLAREAGLTGGGRWRPANRSVAGDDRPAEGADGIEAAALRAGVEAWPVQASYREVADGLCAAGPALIRLPGGAGWLAVVRGGSRLRVVEPDGGVTRLAVGRLVEALRRPLEASADDEIEGLLAHAGVASPRRRSRVRRALLAERLGGEPCARGWSLRLPPSAGALEQLRRAGVFGRLVRLAVAHTVAWLLLIASWAVLGRGVLDGRLDPGWLTAWALLLATLIPLQAVALWSEGTAALTAGVLLKRRLLAGSLRFGAEEIRRQGAGELLGRVIEAERVEGLAFGGGLTALLAAVELALAAAVLALGAGGALHSVLLAAWVLALALAGWWLYGERGAWAEERIGMTQRFVERLLGHRTRLVQESRATWHDAEDDELAAYLRRSRRLDRLMPRIETFAARGWLIAALAALAPALFAGDTSAAGVAVALGGMLLAARGLEGMAGGLSGLTAAAVAWRQVGPLYQAATRRQPVGSPAVRAEAGGDGGEEVVLAARGLDFRYPGRSRPAVEDCGIELRRGDRVLLTGESGSGKSTLISLLAALRQPQGGLLLLHGADLHGWGALNWRRRVVAAPQFHDNHLFAAPLAFNLLLGRSWPPAPDDLAEAAEICEELGLGDLVARMPSGLMQPIGENGWRLSHGEASRVYLARALLQEPDLVLLDESFAALDPASLQAALACARSRARTLVVATHR
ncbi:MAG: ATP-binding cassette domain-containing protein [Acidobacteriota bacterium]